MAKLFEAPIPGQSLTGTPKNAPWERPPQIVEPKDALKFHMKRLENPEVMDAILTFVEMGTDLKTLSEGITRGAVSEGIHNIDISLMVQPAIHEFLRVMSKASGIEVDEGFVDKEQARIEEEFKIQVKARRMRGEEQEPPMEEEQVEEEPMEEQEEPERKGLMARRM